MIALVISLAVAAPPVAYQGRLLDTVGVPMQGTPSVAFAIYDQAEDIAPEEGQPPPDNSPIWTETLTVSLQDGYFAVNLGLQSDLDGVFMGDDRWVEMTVAGSAMQRQPIHSVPMANWSVNADTAARLTEWSQWDPVDYAAAAGLCAGMLHDSYGRLKVVRFNGSGCDSTCNSQDTGTGPYQNYHCYGAVGSDSIRSASGDPGSNEVVFNGWFGVNYCSGVNGTNRFCCCKSNYTNNAN